MTRLAVRHSSKSTGLSTMTQKAQDSIARLLRLNAMNLRLNGDRSAVLAPGRLVEIGDEKIMKKILP